MLKLYQWMNGIVFAIYKRYKLIVGTETFAYDCISFVIMLNTQHHI